MTREAQHRFFNLDARILLSLIDGPDKRDAADSLFDLRRFASARSDPRSTSWQELWNSATGATAQRPGHFSFYAYVRCQTCHGRRFDMRTGVACHSCLGRGKTNTELRVTARYAPLPPKES